MRQAASLTQRWVRHSPLQRQAAVARLARLAPVCQAALASSKGPAPPPPTPQNIAYPSATELDGQVVSAKANFVAVKVSPTEGPAVELLCIVRALLKKIKQRVLVGDAVRVVSIDWPALRGMVDDVEPRKSELGDPAVANVDNVLVVFSMADPPWDGQMATRFLVCAERAQIPVCIVLNKADLATPEQAAATITEVESWGYQAFPVSAATGAGLSAMHELLAGTISVVAGPSGAGKSSIINAIWAQQEAASPGSNDRRRSGRLAEAARSTSLAQLGGLHGLREDGRVEHPAEGSPADTPCSQAEAGAGGPEASTSATAAHAPAYRNGALQQPAADGQAPAPAISTAQWLAELAEAEAAQARLSVGDVSAIGRGRHTTRNVTLLEVAGGLLADTPGFNQPSLEGMPAAELPEHFPEIQDRLGSCAFKNCTHALEPGCNIRPGWARHPWYVQLREELQEREDLMRHRTMGKRTRQGHSRIKQRTGGGTQREAKLNPKAHRRTSRREVNKEVAVADRELAVEEEEDRELFKQMGL